MGAIHVPKGQLKIALGGRGMLLAALLSVVRVGVVVIVPAHSVETLISPRECHRRVLVVDDHLDTRDMLSAYLSLFGHEVRMAPDGVEGLNVARLFLPEIVLLDIWMPRMDGLETCQRLRRDPLIRSAAVYALSAGSTAELHGAECFDAFFRKPVELDRLAEVVAHPLRTSLQ